jgi:toxin ParE1/3/4
VTRRPAAHRLTRQADADLGGLLDWTLVNFGARQFRTYAPLMERAIEAVAREPERPGSSRRDELGSGIRTFHVGLMAQRHGATRHVYRVANDGVVEIVRILHDAMDISRHMAD